jgi:hypothetical protein
MRSRSHIVGWLESAAAPRQCRLHQAILLAANQCDLMQGNWFGAAQPAAAIEVMLCDGPQGPVIASPGGG